MDRHCPAGRRIGDTKPISDLKPLFNQNQVFITFLMIILADLIRSYVISVMSLDPCATLGHQPLGPIPPLFPRVY